MTTTFIPQESVDPEYTPLDGKILQDEASIDGKMLQDEEQDEEKMPSQEEEQKLPDLNECHIDEAKVPMMKHEINPIDEIVKLLENKYKHKLDLYEKLGKSCPSFASFEIAVNENKGAKLLRSNAYHIFNINELFHAWSENMTFLTKRKKSEKHWQAGLKKWLDGQWRKDKRTFDLVLKEQKIAEANQIRSLISQLFRVKEEILGVVKEPTIVHHHHHYYCKCGSPSSRSEPRMEKNGGEVHHHHIHYVDEQTPNVPLEVPPPISDKIKTEPSTDCLDPPNGDKMDYEVINDMTEDVKTIKKSSHTKKRKINRSSPQRRKKQNQLYSQQHNQSFTQQNQLYSQQQNQPFSQQSQLYSQQQLNQPFSQHQNQPFSQQNQLYSQQLNQSFSQQNQSYSQQPFSQQNQLYSQHQNQPFSQQNQLYSQQHSQTTIDLSPSDTEWTDEVNQVQWQMTDVPISQGKWGSQIQVPQVQWPHVQYQIPQVQWPLSEHVQNGQSWPFSEIPMLQEVQWPSINLT